MPEVFGRELDIPMNLKQGEVCQVIPLGQSCRSIFIESGSRLFHDSTLQIRIWSQEDATLIYFIFICTYSVNPYFSP